MTIVSKTILLYKIILKYNIYKMAGARNYNPPPPFFSSPSPFNHQLQHSREPGAAAWLKSVAAKSTRTAQDFKSEMSWLSSSEAKERAAAAKFIAGSNFKKRFPHADMSRFQIQVEFDVNRKALGRVLFPDGDGSWENPLIAGRNLSKTLWGCNKIVASLISCHHLHKTSLYQSRRLIFLTPQGQASLIFLTKRLRST